MTLQDLNANPWRVLGQEEAAEERRRAFDQALEAMPSPYRAEIDTLNARKQGLDAIDAAFAQLEGQLSGLTSGAWDPSRPAQPATVSQPAPQAPAAPPTFQGDDTPRFDNTVPASFRDYQARRNQAPSLPAVTGDPAAGMPDVWPAGAAETSGALDPRGERTGGLPAEQVAPLVPEQPASRRGAQRQDEYAQNRVHEWEPTTSAALDAAMSGSLAEGMKKAVPEMGQALREQVDRIPLSGLAGDVVKAGGRAVVNRVEQLAGDMAATQAVIEEQGASGNAVGALASAGATGATAIPATAQAGASGIMGALAKGLLGNDDDVFEWAKSLGVRKDTPVLGGALNPVEASSAITAPATFVDRAVGTLLHLGASGIKVTPAIVREVARQNAIDADVLLTEVVKQGSRLAGPATEAGTRLVEGGVKAATGAFEGAQDLAGRAAEGVRTFGERLAAEGGLVEDPAALSGFGKPTTSDAFGIRGARPDDIEARVLAGATGSREEVAALPGAPGSRAGATFAGAPRTESPYPMPPEVRERTTAQVSEDGRRVAETPYEYLAGMLRDYMDSRGFYPEFGTFFRSLATRDGRFDAGLFNELNAAWAATAAQTAPHDNLTKALMAVLAGRRYREEVGRLPTGAELWKLLHQGVIVDGLDSVGGGAHTKIVGEGRLVGEAGDVKLVGSARKITVADANKIVSAWQTGAVEIPTNFKLTAFALDTDAAGKNEYSPFSVIDTHMLRLAGYADPGEAGGNPSASRYVQALLYRLAEDTGLTPHEVQSALWFGAKNEVAPPDGRGKRFSHTVRLTLDTAGHRAGEVVNDGTLAFSIEKNRSVIDRFLAEVDGPTTEAAGHAVVFHPGKPSGRGKPTFTLDPAAQERGLAYAENTGFNFQVPADRLAGDVDEATGQIGWLAARNVPHRVAVGPDGNASVQLYTRNGEAASRIAREVRTRAGLGEPVTALRPADDGALAVIQVDKADGAEWTAREVEAARSAGAAGFHVSPDGRSLVFRDADAGDVAARLERAGLTDLDIQPVRADAVSGIVAGRGSGATTADGSFLGALADPAERQSLIGAVGRQFDLLPRESEVLPSNIGAASGAVAGATSTNEDDSPLDVAGRVLTGAAGGALAGRSAARIARAANPAASRIVPVEVARALPGDVRLPDDPAFRAAVEATPGEALTPDGLEIELERFQKPRQAGQPTPRGSVFYGPAGDPTLAGYRTDDPKALFGGSQRVAGRTLLRRPLVVETDGPHGDIGVDAYAAVAGDDAATRLFEQTGEIAGDWLRPPSGRRALADRVEAILDEHGVPDARKAAERIASTSPTAAGIAVEELVGATAARRAGYDSVVGLADGKVDQVVDIREARYPTPDGRFSLNPEFAPSRARRPGARSGIVAGGIRTYGGSGAQAVAPPANLSGADPVGRPAVPASQQGAVPRPSLGQRAWDATRAATRLHGDYTRANLLLNPATHVRNVVGNATALVLGPLETAGAAAAETVMAPLQGRQRAVTWAEVPAEVRGTVAALPDAFTSAWAKLKAEADFSTAGRGARSVARTPFTLLGVADEFFGSLAEGGATSRLAKRHGFRPTADEVKAVRHYRTFQQSDQITDALTKLSDVPVIGPLVLTFVKTPYNVAKFELERTPLAIGTVAKGYADAARDPAKAGEAAERAGRLLVAGLFTYLAYRAAQEGAITGSRPDDPDEAEAWDRAGKQPLSILGPDGKWYSYAQLTGVSLNLAATANMVAALEKAGKDPDPARGWKLVAGAAEVLTHKSFMDSFAVLFGALMDPEQGLSRLQTWGERTLVGQVPGSSLLRSAETATDPHQRQAATTLEKVQAILPWEYLAGVPGAKALPVRRDAYGRPQANRRAGLAGLNPFPASEPKRDPVDGELTALAERTGEYVGPRSVGPRGKIAGQPLSRADRVAYQQEAGDETYLALDRLFNTSRYNSADPKEQQELIRATIAQARRRAGLRVVPEVERGR